jgi:hypothetical protein
MWWFEVLQINKMLEIRQKGVLYILYNDGKPIMKRGGFPQSFLEKKDAEKYVKKFINKQDEWFKELYKEEEKPAQYFIETNGKKYPFFGKLHQVKVYARRMSNKGSFMVYKGDEFIYEKK